MSFKKMLVLAVIVAASVVWAQSAQSRSTVGVIVDVESGSSVGNAATGRMHTIRFNSGGGTAPANLTGMRGDDVVLPSTTRRGFTFLGWFPSPEGGRSRGQAGDIYQIISDATLYAQWEQNVQATPPPPSAQQRSAPTQQRTIRFDSRGGTVIANITVNVRNCDSEPIIWTRLPSTSRSGHTFIAWYCVSGIFVGQGGTSVLVERWGNDSTSIIVPLVDGNGQRGTRFRNREPLIAVWRENNPNTAVHPIVGTWRRSDGRMTLVFNSNGTGFSLRCRNFASLGDSFTWKDNAGTIELYIPNGRIERIAYSGGNQLQSEWGVFGRTEWRNDFLPNFLL